MSGKLGLKKRREQFMGVLTGEANDSWAAVELFRWQYGELPKPGDLRRMSIPEAMRKMADGFMAKSPSGWPSPMNLMSVFEYAAKEIENLNKALAVKMDAMPSGLSAGQSMALAEETLRLCHMIGKFPAGEHQTQTSLLAESIYGVLVGSKTEVKS